MNLMEIQGVKPVRWEDSVKSTEHYHYSWVVIAYNLAQRVVQVRIHDFF